MGKAWRADFWAVLYGGFFGRYNRGGAEFWGGFFCKISKMGLDMVYILAYNGDKLDNKRAHSKLNTSTSVLNIRAKMGRAI